MKKILSTMALVGLLCTLSAFTIGCTDAKKTTTTLTPTVTMTATPTVTLTPTPTKVP